MSFRRRIGRMWEKSGEEARAFLSGKAPGFVVGRGLAPGEIPVFVFHAVAPRRFDAQLRFLCENGYETLDADALLTAAGTGKRVVLTFDDATWTFAAYAFPLLRRYGLRAVLFAIPGIVPDDDTRYPTLEDVEAGDATLEDVDRRGHAQPLCSRRELLAMHESGLVDIQSHSLTHQRVPVAPRVVDFLHPSYDADSYGNVRIPVSVLDDPRLPARERRLGGPVFASAPRLAGQRRFVEDASLVESLVKKARSDERFFDRRDWHRELEQVLDTWPEARRGALESEQEMVDGMRWEIGESRRILEEMLETEVRHLCYPWFRGSALADRLADEAGYRATYYGLLPPAPPSGTELRTIARISEEYLLRLPGAGREPLRAVWSRKVKRPRGD